MSDQVYTGTANIASGSSDWNALNFAIKQMMGRMATCTIVVVKAVNGLRVAVQPIVAQLDGAGNAVAHGTIYDVPVWRYQAGTSAVILDPIVGDLGIALFAHTDISSVKNTKQAGNPGSRRRFDWADGMYLGGILNGEPTQFVKLDATGINVVSNSAVVITAPVTRIHGDFTVTGNTNVQGDLTLTSDSAVILNAPVTRVQGDLTVTGDSTFNGKSFDTHTHGGVTAGSDDSGPPS